MQGAAFDLKKELGNIFPEGWPKIEPKTLNQSPPPRPNYKFEWFGQTMEYPELQVKLRWGTRELRWDVRLSIDTLRVSRY
jgi:hypothetical protein